MGVGPAIAHFACAAAASRLGPELILAARSFRTAQAHCLKTSNEVRHRQRLERVSLLASSAGNPAVGNKPEKAKQRRKRGDPARLDRVVNEQP